MKNISANSLYSSRIEKNVLLAEGYTEIPKLSFIIKMCRLKPYSYFFERNKNLELERWWFDEYLNSFKIKNKDIDIIYGDLTLDSDKIITTDLYYGLNKNNVLKISKLIFISYGKDEDLYQDVILISLLGIDGFLRTYLYYYGEWRQASPLLLGIDNLKLIAKNRRLKYFKEIPFSKNTMMPCVTTKSWLSYIPVGKELLSTLEQQCNIIFNILKG